MGENARGLWYGAAKGAACGHGGPIGKGDPHLRPAGPAGCGIREGRSRTGYDNGGLSGDRPDAAGGHLQESVPV